jgi:hypothetical protein
MDIATVTAAQQQVFFVFWGIAARGTKMELRLYYDQYGQGLRPKAVVW